MDRSRLSSATTHADHMKFVRLREKGMSFRAIAKEMDTSTTTVCRWINRWKRECNMETRKSKGASAKPRGKDPSSHSFKICKSWKPLNDNRPVSSSTAACALGGRCAAMSLPLSQRFGWDGTTARHPSYTDQTLKYYLTLYAVCHQLLQTELLGTPCLCTECLRMIAVTDYPSISSQTFGNTVHEKCHSRSL